MIGAAPAGQPVHLKLRMDVQQVPGLKTGTVWGTLKGTTDETIYVEAHRDGWFESATDNASGVATMLGHRRVLREGAGGAAPPHDHLPWHLGPPQQRTEQRGVARRAS